MSGWEAVIVFPIGPPTVNRRFRRLPHRARGQTNHCSTHCRTSIASQDRLQNGAADKCPAANIAGELVPVALLAFVLGHHLKETPVDQAVPPMFYWEAGVCL